MDLAFTPEEQQFREDIRAWVKDNLPADISHKVHNALRLSRDDMQRWGKILGKKGWLGHGWPKQFGGPGWNAVQKHLFEEECALAGAPRVVPFGPVMVAPVIMAFGNAEQQQRFLPGIASGEVWWSQGYSEPGSGSDLASLKTRAERRGDKYIVNGQKAWTTLGQYGDWIFCLVRTRHDRQAADRHQLPADRHEDPGRHRAPAASCWTASARSTRCSSTTSRCRPRT
jgi:alkylation response protein AidB-like acyl-CoA dehydrogenase